VHLPIRQRDDAGQPRARDLSQRPLHAGEEARALVAALRHLDGAQLELGQAGGAGLDGGAGGLDLRGAGADDAGGFAAVHHQQGDVGPRLARLLDQARVGQRQQQQGEGAGAQRQPARRADAQPAPRVAPHAGQQQREQREHAERGQQPGRQGRARSRRRRDLVHPRLNSPAARGWPARAPGRPCSSGQRVHHQVHPEAVGQRALPRPARDHRQGVVPRASIAQAAAPVMPVR
jgi:hypothetical protein